MQHLIIKFPFSSVNDEPYTLAMCIHFPYTIQSTLDVLDADSEVFTHEEDVIDGADTIHYYIGTLTGSVTATDDDRDDIFEPIVASKLSFNMACQTFPQWLMDFANLRFATVILYKDDNKINHEMWRGYIVAQSLNMTVVNNLMTCSLVAVDEIGMAKYMPLKDNILEGAPSLSIITLMEWFHSIHHNQGFTLYGQYGVGFEYYYRKLNLSHSNRLLWHRDMKIIDDDGAAMRALPTVLVANLDLWLQDDTATWNDMLDAVCRFLGVTFCIGSYGLMTVNDAYMLICPTDPGNVQQFVYTFGGSYTSHSYSVYETITNPFKIGGDLQVTSTPDRFKSVSVKSKPERWESHEYLTNDGYPCVDRKKCIRRKFGSAPDQASGDFDTLQTHVMYYLRAADSEKDYIDIPPCVDGEGYLMARDGELPYDNLLSCVGVGQPTSQQADSLDFITFKEGATMVKLGSGEPLDLAYDEPVGLTSYFLLMNHMWGNMMLRKSHTMSATHIRNSPWITFSPIGKAGAIHPSGKHYLKIEMDVKFIRENMAKNDVGTAPLEPYEPADINTPKVAVCLPAAGVEGNTTVLLPCESSDYNHFDDDHGLYDVIDWGRFRLYLRLGIGDTYYDGSGWVDVPDGQTPPSFPIYLRSKEEFSPANHYGITWPQDQEYYYKNASAWLGNTNAKYAIIPLEGLSIHNRQLGGELKLTVLGQIPFFNTLYGDGNSIPFVLVKDVKIGYTDDAELESLNIENDAVVNMDYYSATKEPMERNLVMATPKVDGFFNNVLVYDGGKMWHNVGDIYTQAGTNPTTAEAMLARMLGAQYGAGQCYVELSTPVKYDDNIHNVGFVVTGLTEAEGKFMPLKRTFDYRMERMRVKLQRVNS